MQIEEHMGQQVTKARTAAGLSLEDLAQQARIDPAKLAAYEEGRERIPAPHLTRLALVLRVSLTQFFPRPVPVPMERDRRNKRKNPKWDDEVKS